MQWEYYVKDFKFEENKIEDGFPNKLEHDDLTHLGNAGWELINIVSYRSTDNELGVTRVIQVGNRDDLRAAIC